MATTPQPKSLFDKYKKALSSAGIERRTIEAQNWFNLKLRSTRKINELQFLQDSNLIRKPRFLPGFMYQFMYDPKTKESLPYYDRFPLILAVQPAPGGFYGINLHYLHPLTRALLLDKLMIVANKKELDEGTRLRLTYNLLSSVRRYKEFKPCFKHYLTDHIQSKLALVPATEWDIAIFLPTERFEGMSRSNVWKQSKKEYMRP